MHLPPAGLEATQHMLYSPLTDHVHITGGTVAHDAIVWGSSPEDQARRKAANDPLLKVLRADHVTAAGFDSQLSIAFRRAWRSDYVVFM